MTPAELTRPSYASEWTVVQVLSHLGSSAEIFTQFLLAGLTGGPAPDSSQFPPVWERWNAKPPAEQAADALAADAALLERLHALDEKERERWHLDLFGTEQDLLGLVQMRLSEHALHSWDVMVTGDPDAELAPDAVDLLVDGLERLAGRVGRPTEGSLRIPIVTHNPSRRFLFAADGEGVALQPEGAAPAGDEDASIRLPAEALVRLVYGRLDPEHTPIPESDDLDALRRVFPGL